MAEAALPLHSVDVLTMLPSALTPLSASAPDANALEFDLGDLSLDLTAPAQPDRKSVGEEKSVAPGRLRDVEDGEAAAHDDPLATKLALAEELNAIGDTDGARTLIEEVVAEATGALKTRAQRLLAELG